MRRWERGLLVTIMLAVLGPMTPRVAFGQTVVRAVLFFSPTCPHCHQVINEDLPVIFERFGGEPRVWVNERVPQADRTFFLVENGQLEILLVDASRQAGAALYDHASQRFLVPRERMGVPRLIIGTTVLVGSIEIPSQLPEMVRQALPAGGVDWPALDGLRERIPAVPSTGTAPQRGDELRSADRAETLPDSAPSGGSAGRQAPSEDAPTTPPDPSSDVEDAARPMLGPTSQATEATLDAVPQTRDGVWDRFGRDPLANALAVIVLAIMLLSIYVVFARAPGWHARDSASGLLLVLAVVGLTVAGYLSYLEASGAAAVCGPVGDCNAVQQSPYARLFGIPVGVLGLVGYLLIIVAWTLGRGDGRIATWSTAMLFGMVFVGVLFSSYLTFLEPFVIGATCLWCLSSAAVLTAMLWLTAGPGFRALARLRHGIRTEAPARE